MHLKFPIAEAAEHYVFNFYKRQEYEKKIIQQIESKGQFNLKLYPKEETQEYYDLVFRNEIYSQAGVKDPFVFNPVKWRLDKKSNIAYVKSKDNMKIAWQRYKDKYRRPENIASLLVIERLYFNAPLGFEYSSYSTGPYLPFFINIFDIELDSEIVIKGQDWLLIPVNIPVNTHFKCAAITPDNIILDGWISLDEEKLDTLLAKESFRDKAKSYHFSKDFRLISEIKVCIDIHTSYLHSAIFKLNIDGEDGKLKEDMHYEIKRNFDTLAEDDNSKIIKGRYRIIDPY